MRLKYVLSSISDTYNFKKNPNVIFLNTGDILSGKILYSNYSNARDLPGQAKKSIKNGDILFSEIRPANKRFALVNVENPEDYVVSTKLMVLRKKNDEFLTEYIYAFLTQERVLEQLQTMAESRSGTFPQITFTEIEALDIPAVSIDEQRHIVDILGTLDEKIENNERLYQQIEKECALIFNQVMQSDTTERIALSDVADFYGGYSYSGEELVESSDTGLVTIKNFERTGGFKIEGFKPLCVKGKIKESAYCEIGSLLVAHTDLTQNADIIGNPVLVLSSGQYKNLVASMDLVKVVPKSYFSERILYLLLKSADFKGHALGYSAGTTVLHLSKKALQEYQFNCPCKDTVNNLDKQLYPLFERLKIILFENLKLSELKQLYLKKFFG